VLRYLRCLTTVALLALAVAAPSAGVQARAGWQAPTAEPTPAPSSAAPERTSPTDVILATTTSTQDTDLLDTLIPMFQEQTGYVVKTIAVGSGQAMALGERGEADVLLVHAPDAEERFVAAGNGINRQLVMHNDFVVLGPASDPAGIKGSETAVEALTRIAGSGATFVSRGDNSGTHQLELKLWQQAALDPHGQAWYQESGTGMGQTLAIASEKEAYTISDRGTYLKQRANISLEILVEGDRSLLNVYHVIQVNPEKFPQVNAAGAEAFVQFMVAPATQEVIGSFGVEQFGQPLFFPDAGKAEELLGG